MIGKESFLKLLFSFNSIYINVVVFSIECISLIKYVYHVSSLMAIDTFSDQWEYFDFIELRDMFFVCDQCILS